MADSESFTALSYTWEDPTKNRMIDIDGQYLPITRNLEDPLRYLRHKEKVLRLWADSICIDQDDIQERNRHVAHILTIYGAARDTNYHLLGQVKRQVEEHPPS